VPPALKSWRLVPHDPHAAHALAAALRVSPVVAQMLVRRRVTDAAAGRAFLDPPLAGLHAPAELPGVAAAADAIIRAAAAGEKICVYGDYDVDGTTGTAILLGLLKRIGAAAEFYIPNRREEGYGLNADAVRALAASGVGLIVTVDCGVSAVAEAAVAQGSGVKLVVTDHHEFKPTLPAAAAVVHPRLPGGGYPNPDLCGAGVAFKLAWAVAQRASGSDKVRPKFRDYLCDATALAALGTVADVVPLTGENRVFVRHGLDRLMDAPTVGLKALLAAAGLAGKPLLAEDIAYKLGPRLNAAGRLECARQVVELLTTDNPVRAAELADCLERLNGQRQTIERRTTQQAKEMVEANGYDTHAGIVLASAGWHPGVVGIVASRVAESYARPALVIALSDDGRPAAGSGRSVAGFPLHEALDACTGCLESHGGHAAAAGFKVKPENVDALRERFAAYVRAHFAGGMPAPVLTAEGEVPLSALTFGLLNDLARLEPYGQGNARPKFLASGLTLVDTPRRIGQDAKHLAFRVRQGESSIRGVAWGMGDRLDELMSEGGDCCLMFTPKVNEWNGQRTVEVEVADLRAGADPRLE